MFDKNVFATRFKVLRKQQNLTQQDMANLLSVTKTQISDIENAKTTTSIERLYAISEIFHVTLDFLVGKTDYSYVTYVQDDPLGVSYGIFACDSSGETIKVENISENPDVISALVRKMNQNSLALCHVLDVIEDFISGLSY